MTAETLKPFITPQSMDNFPAPQSNKLRQRQLKNGNFVAICFSIIGAVFLAIVIGFTIWNTVRIRKLETELKSLNLLVESMQKRLGLHYLDDLNDFEKEYTNALIDDPNTAATHIDNDDKEDDEYPNKENENINDNEDSDLLSEEYDEAYDDLIKKYTDFGDDNENDDENDDDENISDDGDLYVDFEKFKDSKNKKQRSRKTRSITALTNDFLTNQGEVYFTEDRKSTRTVPNEEAAELLNQQRIAKPFLRQRLNWDPLTGRSRKHSATDILNSKNSPSSMRQIRNRRRKVPILKSAKSPYFNKISRTAAAHFHLNKKVPERYGAIRVNAYPGDMYIGHPSWTRDDDENESYFKVENGVLTVLEPGLYYIYAQICYNNTHDQNGFVIFHGHKPFLQCLNTVPTNLPLKIHTCHTSGIIQLQAEETIHLRDFHSDRNVILKDTNNRSYFGIIKI